MPIHHVSRKWSYLDTMDNCAAIKKNRRRREDVFYRRRTSNICQHGSFCCCFCLWVSRWLETVYLCSVIMQLTITGSEKVNLLLNLNALDLGQHTMDMKFALFMPQCAFIALLIGSVRSIPSHSAATGQHSRSKNWKKKHLLWPHL